MTQDSVFHGGLIVEGADCGLLDRCSRIVAATLDDFGHPVERNSIHSDAAALITASHYAVRLALMPVPTRAAAGFARAPFQGRAASHRWRIEIGMSPADHRRNDGDISELLLVVMLFRMTNAFETEAIEWLDPLTVLTADQFAEAFAKITPGVTAHRGPLGSIDNPRFAPVEDTAQVLDLHCDAISGQAATAPGNVVAMPGSEPAEAPPAQRGSATGPAAVVSFAAHKARLLAAAAAPQPPEEDEDAPSDILRLATWGMTGMLAFLSAPVAASMAAVNLLRGEDLRLNTHVLSLTGLLFTLQSTGMLATAVNALPL